jgi:hypothetical protein
MDPCFTLISGWLIEVFECVCAETVSSEHLPPCTDVHMWSFTDATFKYVFFRSHVAHMVLRTTTLSYNERADILQNELRLLNQCSTRV